MYERLKALRKYLHLSQAYAAEQMGMSRSTLSTIESGKRKITAEELEGFSKLYGVSIDEIVYDNKDEASEARMLFEEFNELSERDKEEVMVLIRFKKQYKTQKDSE